MKKILVLLVVTWGLTLMEGGNAMAQTNMKATSVLVNLSPKPGIGRDRFEPIMLEEVSETVQAYLDGRILQWWSKADGTGVVFILNATSVDDAKAIMVSLPLDRAGLVELQFTPLAPLQPLKRLLNSTKK